MTLRLDEEELRRKLEPLLDDTDFRAGVANVASDPFFLAFFLASVSEGEGLGESAVALIGQDELAKRIRDLERQEREERGHKERSLDAARALFPDYFAEVAIATRTRSTAPPTTSRCSRRTGRA